jgi:hypothetical protein
MILSPVPNSRRPEIITTVSAAQRLIPASINGITVREGTIAIVKNVGKIRATNNGDIRQYITHTRFRLISLAK